MYNYELFFGLTNNQFCLFANILALLPHTSSFIKYSIHVTKKKVVRYVFEETKFEIKAYTYLAKVLTHLGTSIFMK